MATPIEILLRKRSHIKSSFTKVKTYISNLSLTNARIEEIRIRIRHTEQLYKEFVEVEEKIYAINKDDISQHEAIEEAYYALLAGLNEWERQMTLSTGVVDSTLNDTMGGHRTAAPEVKLPGLRVPTFNGDYTEWQTFYQLFSSTIHNNTNLHPVQKYQFLVNSLGDEPARLIRHMDITEANYILALNKLRERYDRKRHTVNKFIQMFLNQPAVSKLNSKNLRKMIDTSDEVVRALQGLGNEANGRDVWLLYILVTKLDDDTRTLWMQHSVQTEFPSLDSFFKFIINQADALEYQGGRIHEERPRSSNPNTYTKPSVKAFTSIITNCPICKTEEHPIYKCQKFAQMSIEQRREIIKEENRCFNCLGRNHSARECRSYRRCKHCQRRHHTLVHELYNSASPNKTSPTKVASNATGLGLTNTEEQVATAATPEAVKLMSTELTDVSSGTISVLPTAVVRVQDRAGSWQLCRVLLDSGAEASFISVECVQRLGLARSEAKMIIRGLGHQNIGQTKGRTQFTLKPHFASEFEISVSAYITMHVTSTKAPSTIESSVLKILKDKKLADPSPDKVTRIDILIGIDQFWSLLSEGQLREGNKVIGQNSKLGWLIAGTFNNNRAPSVMSLRVDERIEQSLLRFWESEEIEKEDKPLEYNSCEEHFIQNHSRDEQGRFIVKLPFKDDIQLLGDSYAAAKSRLLSMERKFALNEGFHSRYKSFMEEYRELNHMTIAERPDDPGAVYLPHHGVVKESSATTKLRVVFDASALTSTGMSLNSILEVGPTIQNSLYHILVKFRKHRIAFTADIEKMYRQIAIHPFDRKYQRILWRENSEEPIQVYELNTVTYGMASSSFLATRVLQEVAEENRNQYPKAAQTIKSEMYMDDLMSGGDSIADATKLSLEVDAILKGAGMILRKWRSNSQQFIDGFTSAETALQSPIELKTTEATQVLGLQWKPASDTFTYQVQLNETPSFTKRRMLSEFSRIFDPLGLISPFIIKIKIMFQQLWLLQITWDEPLPHKEQQEWLSLRREIPQLKAVSVRRWLGIKNGNATIHGFSDASERAYAAAVYLCTETDGIYNAQLITAKTKVAPTNTVSIARLELCGALLLAKLMKQVGEILEVSKDNMVAWTDSSIVLDWLSDTPQRWKTYVANRTSKILNILPKDYWHHVPSTLNPADCATRGLSPSELQLFHLWWHGPEYILRSKDQWPKMVRIKNPTVEHKCLIMTINSQDIVVNFIYELQERYSSFTKLSVVVAYIYRVLNIVRRKRPKETRGRLVRDELNQAISRVYRAVQCKAFGAELQKLRVGERIPRESKLVTLDPFIDDVGVLRVGGRIEHAPIHYEQCHPIILPNHDPIVSKMIVEQHINNFHCGPSYLLHLLRRKYWILGIRSTIRGIFRSCVQCIKQRPRWPNQKMGSLPKERVEIVKPFLRTGVDFAGPIRTVLIHGRGQRVRKSYVCVFVCMCTKALHIEVTGDLSTESFLAAFNRFLARRRTCTDIYSDNGSNFKGARKTIDELNKFILEHGEQMATQVLRQHQTNWHFIPVYSPHFGGLWEAGVKAIKTQLQRVTGERVISNEELHTLLVQIEGMLNNRPLCTNGPELQDVLTPAHYLVGTQCVSLPYPDITHIAYNRLNHWQAIQKMVQIMWRRWYKEYVHSMQQRFKWKHNEPNVRVDQIMLIKDDNPFVNVWRLGKVLKLHTGGDGKVRLVTLKTADGETQRVIHKLCPLPSQ